MRALLLLVSLALVAVAAIPVVGDLAGVRLMSPPGGGPASPEAPRVLLNNNFVVALFWAAGWLTLALLCAAAALALDQQKRMLRLYRKLDRRLEQPEQPARPAAKPAEPQRPAARRRFEPRLATTPAPAPERDADWQEALDDPPTRGPVLRADR